MTQYEKLNFVNGSPPALNAATLNHIEDGIVAATEGVTALEETVKNKPDFDDVYTVEEADEHFLSKYDAGNTYATKTDLSTKLDNTAGSVTTDNIASKAVTADKIANGAITSIKIADNAIVSSQIVANQISANHLQSGAVTVDKLANNVIETGSGDLNIPVGDDGKTQSATFKYQRVGDYVDVSIYIVFNDFTTKIDTRAGYGNLPYVCKGDLPINGACAYNKKLVEWYVANESNGIDLKLPDNTIFIGGTNLTFNIKYRIA